MRMCTLTTDYVLRIARGEQHAQQAAPHVDKNIYVMIPSLLDTRQYSIIYNTFEVL
jgi:hypothetical protein